MKSQSIIWILAVIVLICVAYLALTVVWDMQKREGSKDVEPLFFGLMDSAATDIANTKAKPASVASS